MSLIYCMQSCERKCGETTSRTVLCRRKRKLIELRKHKKTQEITKSGNKLWCLIFSYSTPRRFHLWSLILRQKWSPIDENCFHNVRTVKLLPLLWSVVGNVNQLTCITYVTFLSHHWEITSKETTFLPEINDSFSNFLCVAGNIMYILYLKRFR